MAWRCSGQSSRGRGRVLRAVRLRQQVPPRTRSRKGPDNRLAASSWRPDAGSELAEMGPNRGRSSGEQIADQTAYGGAGTDFLWCELLSRAKGVIGLLVFAPLAERLRGVHEERCLSLGHGQLLQVHFAGVVDRRPGVAEADRDVDSVKEDVGGPERGPPVVVIAAEAGAGLPGLVQQG